MAHPRKLIATLAASLSLAFAGQALADPQRARQLGELMVRDALERRESCGGHFREESQTEEHEAKRQRVRTFGCAQ